MAAKEKITYRRQGGHRHEWHARERRAFNGTITGYLCKCGAVDYADLIPFNSITNKDKK